MGTDGARVRSSGLDWFACGWRVRGLHVHDQHVDELGSVLPGQRPLQTVRAAGRERAALRARRAPGFGGDLRALARGGLLLRAVIARMLPLYQIDRRLVLLDVLLAAD